MTVGPEVGLAGLVVGTVVGAVVGAGTSSQLTLKTTGLLLEWYGCAIFLSVNLVRNGLVGPTGLLGSCASPHPGIEPGFAKAAIITEVGTLRR